MQRREALPREGAGGEREGQDRHVPVMLQRCLDLLAPALDGPAKKAFYLKREKMDKSVLMAVL